MAVVVNLGLWAPLQYASGTSCPTVTSCVITIIDACYHTPEKKVLLISSFFSSAANLSKPMINVFNVPATAPATGVYTPLTVGHQYCDMWTQLQNWADHLPCTMCRRTPQLNQTSPQLQEEMGTTTLPLRIYYRGWVRHVLLLSVLLV